MPRLSTGRHFGLEPAGLLDGVTQGSERQQYFFIMAYRQEVKTPADLALLLPVLYFEEGKGEPPDAPAYRSGFMVADVLEGK